MIARSALASIVNMHSPSNPLSNLTASSWVIVSNEVPLTLIKSIKLILIIKTHGNNAIAHADFTIETSVSNLANEYSIISGDVGTIRTTDNIESKT